ncbi:hypothetical protein THAOC_25570 [Thalassiosira oceanica]|uniref:Uncharacterized protein n=1 Tax=Thalassiosira oceanica TaxID=159749 RepID=K0S141_THAOC|nr:hypothetical protein THAOC_25570 [Thalassiosira oceanica]|eukprot:EJK54771.1 hypothetical protein THAOC_25570 [Thalassiosira oceanica]
MSRIACPEMAVDQAGGTDKGSPKSYGTRLLEDYAGGQGNELEASAPTSFMTLIVGWILENPVLCSSQSRIAALTIASLRRRLSAEAVEGLSLSLQGVDDVHGSDGLAAGVLGVGDGVTDDVLEEDLEDAAGLLVDETGDTLDTATTGETADGGLGDALDVVAKDLAVALGAALSESLASLSSSRHDDELIGFALQR